MSFMLNNSPLVHSRNPANSSWNNSKFALAKGCSLKSEGDEGIDEQLHIPGIRVPQAINMQNAANGLSASKHTHSVVLNPGSFLLFQGIIPPDYKSVIPRQHLQFCDVLALLRI